MTGEQRWTPRQDAPWTSGPPDAGPQPPGAAPPPGPGGPGGSGGPGPGGSGGPGDPWGGQDPFGRSRSTPRPAVLAAVAIAAVAVLAGGLYLAFGRGSDDDSAGGTTTSAAPASTTTAPATSTTSTTEARTTTTGTTTTTSPRRKPVEITESGVSFRMAGRPSRQSTPAEDPFGGTSYSLQLFIVDDVTSFQMIGVYDTHGQDIQSENALRLMAASLGCTIERVDDVVTDGRGGRSAVVGDCQEDEDAPVLEGELAVIRNEHPVLAVVLAFPGAEPVWSLQELLDTLRFG